jgi:hypothetical protein
VVLEDDHGPVCLVLVAPLFSGGDEHARGFEHAEGQAKRSSVSNNFVGSSRETLDFLDALPEFFDGVLWVPGCGQPCAIIFDLFGLDGRVGCFKVKENGEDADIGIAAVNVLEDAEVAIGDSEQNLLFDFLCDDTEKTVLGKIVFEATIGFSNLGCGCGGDVNRGVAGMDGDIESHTCADEVVGRWHYERKMAGVDGGGIGMKLLLKDLNARVVGRSDDGA